MAALVGVMIMVAFETFDWKSLKLLRVAPSQAVIMPITMVFALWTHDLAEGVAVGLVVSGLIFGLKRMKH